MSGNPPKQVAGVYASDLPEGLTEEEIWQVFAIYGDIVSIEQVSGGGDSEAALVVFSEAEAAKEASGYVNCSFVRGKTVRCLTVDMLEVIRRTMDTGQRLVFTQLDAAIDTCGLWDLCSLFGEVLDCRVETQEGGSHSYGFVHFTREEEAAKAKLFLAGVQLGTCVVEIRPFELADIVLFAGCRYTLPRPKARHGDDDEDDEEEEEEPPLAPGSPEDMERTVWQRFRSLEYHHMEVLQDLEAKLERLKTLVQLYDPSHEMQIVVVAQPANMRPVRRVLGERLEECDFDSLELSMPGDSRKNVMEGYDTGNLYVVVMSSEVCTRPEFDLSKPASVLINFDCPSSLQFHLHRLYKRADGNTRVHNFFSPSCDPRLSVRMLKALEEAGHEIPPELLEFWSTTDQGDDD